MKNKVVLFEIPASDFKKAKDFYRRSSTGRCSCGAMKAPWHSPQRRIKTTIRLSRAGSTAGSIERKSKADQPSCGVETESIDETLKSIEKAGGKVVTAKHSIDEWGFMADFADPEGNVASLWERPKK